MVEPDFKLWGKHPLFPVLRFVDVEASGLHEGSYPIQFGWCGLDLKTSVVLVKPEPEWTLSLFDPKSYEIHGIPYELVKAEGVAAVQVARMLNEELEGKAVVSDNPGWDGYWTTRLGDTTGSAMRFGYNDFGRIPEAFGSVYDRWCVSRYQKLLDAVDQFYPHTHKAHEDALRMAALTRMVIDREWAEWLLDRAARNAPRRDAASAAGDRPDHPGGRTSA
ncbi:hypothetical protein GOB57_22010 [Sinorhizobium meliloti]|nr:hypothetical protein [Sinorhizobium meliloti]